MKTAALILIFLVLLYFSAPAQRPTPTNDEAEILKLMDEVNRAYVARLPEPLERIYLDSFVSIRGRPVFNAKEQLLAMVKADAEDIKLGRSLDFETISYDVENPKVRLFGDTAIVTVVKKNLWRYRDSRCLTRYQSTDVWLKRDGRWRLAAGHSTTFQCTGAPWYPLHIALQGAPTRDKPTIELTGASSVAIHKIFDELNELKAKPADTVSAAAGRIFAEKYVATGVKAEVVEGGAGISTAIRNGTSALQMPREDEACQSYGDTVVCTFRVRPTGSTNTAQVSIVFVNAEGRWQIVASHLS